MKPNITNNRIILKIIIVISLLVLSSLSFKIEPKKRLKNVNKNLLPTMPLFGGNNEAPAEEYYPIDNTGKDKGPKNMNTFSDTPITKPNPSSVNSSKSLSKVSSSSGSSVSSSGSSSNSSGSSSSSSGSSGSSSGSSSSGSSSSGSSASGSTSSSQSASAKKRLKNKNKNKNNVKAPQQRS